MSSLSTSPLPGSCGSLEYDLDELDATHRGCHRFVPRHPEELAIEISDPIYVELEEDDLWCEGRRTLLAFNMELHLNISETVAYTPFMEITFRHDV